MNFNQDRRAKVTAFIDGFNFYHAVDNLNAEHLKWVNLWGLMEEFVHPPTQQLTAVYYFSAIAEWLIEPAKRHKAYINALAANGVTNILGTFKRKEGHCNNCGNTWDQHEEKQTDVNIAVTLIQEAFRDSFDIALMVTQDSDFAPALSLVNSLPKQRQIKLLSPPRMRHSKELAKYCHKLSKIKVVHLERNLLPGQVQDHTGRVIAVRPSIYNPT